MTNTRRGPWAISDHKLIYENPWMTVRYHDVIHNSGHAHEYTTIAFKNRATGIVPLFENGETVLVGQHRFPLDRYSWEIPEGGCPPQEEPHEAALRELREETGLTASNYKEILQLDLSNSITNERAWCYVSWGLNQGEAMPEETEDIALKKIQFSDALEMVEAGEMTDAISVASLLRISYLARNEQLPEPWMNARFRGK